MHTQLLTALQYWTESLEKGTPVDVVCSEAFYSVSHERLFLKLKAYSIQGRILEWIRSFLSERKQAIVVNVVKSSTNDVPDGIPQGSVLGPLLFFIYINDLPNVITSPAVLFADDVKTYCSIISSTQLQHDLPLLKEWSRKWLLIVLCILYG